MGQSERICQRSHSFCKDITWEIHQNQLVWIPVASVLLAGATFYFIHRFGSSTLIWGRGDDDDAGEKARARREFVARRTAWIKQNCNSGTMDMIQILCSSGIVVIWMQRVRYTEVMAIDRMIELGMQIFFLLHYIGRGMVQGLHWSYPWAPPQLADMLTIACSLTVRADLKKTPWIDWSYLRVVQIPMSFKRLVFETLSKEDQTAVTYHTVIFFLTLGTYILAVAGTIMVLEIYGDPDFVDDRTVPTNMGGLSFIQMLYWVTITVSSVGYGDYVPTTRLSKLFTLFVFVVGIGHCIHELMALTALKKSEADGYGEFSITSTVVNRHLVVVGDGVRESSRLFRTFHRELYSQECGLQWPKMCIMSPFPMPETLKECIRNSPFHAVNRTHYFVGDPLSETDGARVRVNRAKLCVVLADRCSKNREKEDRVNLMKALAIKEQRPDSHVFLILLQQESQCVAVRCGLKAPCCIQIYGIATGLVAQSCLCRGWSTLVLNLFMVHDRNDVTSLDGSTSTDDTKSSSTTHEELLSEEKWFAEYRHGCHMSIHAFVIHKRFHNTRFADLAMRMLGNNLVPIAVQIKGKVVVAPMNHRMYAPEDEAFGEIVFAFANVPEHFKSYEDNAAPVGQLYLERQDKACQHDELKQCLATIETSVGSIADEDKNNSAMVPQSEVQEMRSRASTIAQTGDHIVLVMMTPEAWNEVASYIKVLRWERLPHSVPIIVLSSRAPTNKVWNELFNMCTDVAMFVGNPTDVNDLEQCGVHRSRTVVVLEGRNSTNPECNDSNTLITLQSLEHFVASRRPEKHVPIITELFHEESLDYLAELPSTVLPNSPSIRSSEGCAAPTPFFRHPRYVNGDVFSVNCLGAMLAREFYTPGIVELVEHLACGMVSGTKTGVPWQVLVPPKFVGGYYHDLVEAFLEDPLNALPIALYRQRFDAAGHYVVTNPLKRTILKSTDSVIMLAGATFGRRCYKMGLSASFDNPDVPRPTYESSPSAQQNLVVAPTQHDMDVRTRMLQKVGDDMSVEDTIDVEVPLIADSGASAARPLSGQNPSIPTGSNEFKLQRASVAME